MATWWINGELVPGDEASLSITDHGLTVGDGCFETTTIVRGVPFAMRRHLARLRHSLNGLSIDLAMTDEALREAAEQAQALCEAFDGQLRAMSNELTERDVNTCVLLAELRSDDLQRQRQPFQLGQQQHRTLSKILRIFLPTQIIFAGPMVRMLN